MDAILPQPKDLTWQQTSSGHFNVLYNHQQLQLALPVMWIPWKISNKHGKHYIDLSFYPTNLNSKLFCTLYEIENYIIEQISKECCLSIQECIKMYIRSLKTDPKQLYPPRFRVRVPEWMVEDIQPKTYLTGSIKCTGVWWSKTRNEIGCSWTLNDDVIFLMRTV
jgi:hypothetical protein